MMMTTVTLITANITPTINPISEELLTEIEDEVAIVEVDTTMPLVVEYASHTLVILIDVVVTVVLLSLRQ